MKSSAKEGAFLHRHGISFHLSHLPPLYILCHFCSIGKQNSTTCTNSNSQNTQPNNKVVTGKVQMWLMAQVKAYDMR